MIFAPNPIAKNPALSTQSQAPAPAPTPKPKEESSALPQNSTGDTRDKKLEDLWFSDIYFTPEKVAYVWGGVSSYGLKVLECLDLIDFYKALEEGYRGNSSYSITYGKSMYRIERIQTISGPHYSARRMPHKVPDFFQLGIPPALANHLVSLNKATGLILIGGPTGMGKTTTITALLKYFLENEGGFAYTIDDPPEMPLDGLLQWEAWQ